jgi:hypothetical protein
MSQLTTTTDATDRAVAQVAAVEALIAPGSGQGYTALGGLRMFRQAQIRQALDHPAATQDAEQPPGGVPVPGTPQIGSQGREATA